MIINIKTKRADLLAYRKNMKELVNCHQAGEKIVAGEVLDSILCEIGRQHPIDPKTYSLEPEVGTELLKIEDRVIRIKKDTNPIHEVFGIKSDL